VGTVQSEQTQCACSAPILRGETKKQKQKLGPTNDCVKKII